MKTKIFTLLIALVSYTALYAQTSHCVASFTFYQYSGLNYHFYENASTGTQNTYHWYFSDLTDTTVRNLFHTFPHNGAYLACLVVFEINPTTHDTLCSDSTCKIVNVGTTCVASFTAYQYQGLTYHFYENATTGTQNTYHWDFGDGKDTNTRSPYHTFTHTGQYYVCLAVFNIDSTTHDTLCFNYSCQHITVSVSCVASFNYAPYHGLIYHFTENATTGNQNAYHWYFGDGKDTTYRSPYHTFPNYGIYYVCLVVYNINTSTHDTICSNTKCDTIDIEPICVANFSGSQSGLNYHFYVNNSSGSQNTFHWDFGDGTTLDTTYLYPNHKFPHYGQYTVCLTVYNINPTTHDTLCSNTLCKAINISHVCVSSFNAYFVSGFMYHMYENATSGEQNRYHWDFGDGTHKDTAFSHHVFYHTFPGNGLYNVCLTVYHIDTLTHDTLCSDTTCKNVIIGPYCVASFSTPYKYNGFTYHIYENASLGTQNAYHWDFGDGTHKDTTGTHDLITHTYPGNGSYIVCLTVYQINPTSHDTLCTDSTCKLVIIGPYCLASYGFYQYHNLYYHFYENAPAGDQKTYHWDFGDGHTLDTTGRYVSHTFATPGKYYVCLTSYHIDSVHHDTLCHDTRCDSINVILTGIIKTNINNNSLAIYPNPANNELIISYPAYSVKNNTSVEFADMNGKLVKRIFMDRNVVDLDISAWQPGVYLIKIITSDGIIMKKIVKE